MYLSYLPPDIINSLSFNYDKVVKESQYYRIFSSAIVHASPLHLLFNGLSLWSLRIMEYKYGSWFYFIYSLWFLVCGKLMSLGVVYLVLQFQNFNNSSRQVTLLRNMRAIGYSGVIFAWMTVKSLNMPTSSSVRFFGVLNIPSALFPLFSLTMIQLIVPRAGFLGHFSGSFQN